MLAREEDTARLDILDNILFVLFCLFVRARAFIYDETNIIGLCVTRESVSVCGLFRFFSLSLCLSLSLFIYVKNRFFFRTRPKIYEIYTKREERKSNKLSLKNRERVSRSTQTHTRTHSKRERKRARRGGETPRVLLKQRVKRGHVAVIQRARVPEK